VKEVTDMDLIVQKSNFSTKVGVVDFPCTPTIYRSIDFILFFCKNECVVVYTIIFPTFYGECDHSSVLSCLLK
jgi:hypothetical protein